MTNIVQISLKAECLSTADLYAVVAQLSNSMCLRITWNLVLGLLGIIHGSLLQHMFVLQSEKVEKTTKNITIAHKQRDSDLIQKLMTCPFASPPPPPPLSFTKFSQSVSGTGVDYYTPGKWVDIFVAAWVLWLTIVQCSIQMSQYHTCSTLHIMQHESCHCFVNDS